ncbi:MAG: YdjY domain-containing protein [Aureliella sp.]
MRTKNNFAARFRMLGVVVLLCSYAGVCPQSAVAQWEGYEKKLKAVESTFGEPPKMLRLDPNSRVWADKKNKRIVVDGYIALDAGPLEMFACIAGTKEHESVVAVFSKAYVVHAGLLAVGAKKGKPVEWEPEFKAPTGSEIAIEVLWKDEKTGERKRVDARQWVMQATRDEAKPLELNYVFAGSSMWKDEETGEELYQADIGGDLICVSNFSTATLDLPIESTQATSGLLFAAYKGRVPKRGTPVRLVLSVVDEKKKKSSGKELNAASDSKSTSEHEVDAKESKPRTEGPAELPASDQR